MIFCPHCKTEQMNGTMFCSECGWDLQTSAPRGREFDLGELFSTPLPPAAPPAMPVPPNPVSRRNATNSKKIAPEVKNTPPMLTDYPAFSPPAPPPFMPPAPPAMPVPPIAATPNPTLAPAYPTKAINRWLPDLSFMVLNTGRLIESPKYERVVIGRGGDDADNDAPDIDLDQDKGAELGVSRRHAIITFEDEQFFLTDLGSTNRTYINRNPAPKGQPQELHDGDEIRLGNIILKTIFSEEHTLG